MVPVSVCVESESIQHATHKLTDWHDNEWLKNPTIEKMAEWLWKKLESQCSGLCEIVVHETPTARCVYRGEQMTGSRCSRSRWLWHRSSSRSR
ncbi:MAG: hypothetical protein DME96_01240 [Verrucomicrobia bacterium]|nr:MAG: hypothetical protein DME96_01240 [Verrucomicrobiota bacterium]